MILRLTQRLNDKIKAGTLPSAPLDENPYADWSARLFIASRIQYILLSQTVSLYSVAMYGRGITYDGQFIDRALENIREFMTYDGLGLVYMNFIAPTAGIIRFRRALNRSVTSALNEIEATAKLYLAPGKMSPFDVGFKLNETLLPTIATRAPGDRATPREAFKHLEAKHLEA